MLKRRGSGVLLHVSSLPSPFGIGDLGEGAYRFVDFLAAAGQRFWQVLPVNITAPYYHHSPYMSVSAFAGNPLFISPYYLVREGVLKEREIGSIPPFPQGCVAYLQATAFKENLLTIAWRRFRERAKVKKDILFRWEKFCQDNRSWLDDFSLFNALRLRFRNVSWSEWPPDIRDRRCEALRAVGKELADEIQKEQFRQFLFFDQWSSLKKYCNDRRILMIGDLPIYVGHDSADVWSHPELFQLDRKKRPAMVSGVPPDRIGETGQLWGHPLYRWNELKKTGYAWMIRRITHQLQLFDYLRMDHFRGFVNYWAVPAKDKTAITGRWVAAPAHHFFKQLLAKIPSLPLICEDLGVSPPDFREVMDHFGFPGMKVLQFAFGKDLPNNPHAPHHYPENCVVYTGTHDQNTIKGWYAKEATFQDRMRLARYLGKTIPLGELHWDVIRLAMMSVARIAIVPMQDILGEGEEARMNRPGSGEGNWRWRVMEDQLTSSRARRLRIMTTLYGRNG
jgi:4-alpha-glucanotransferase